MEQTKGSHRLWRSLTTAKFSLVSTDFWLGLVNIHKQHKTYSSLFMTYMFIPPWTSVEGLEKLTKCSTSSLFSMMAVSLGVTSPSIDSWFKKQPLGPSFICKNIPNVSLGRYNYSPVFFIGSIQLIMTNHSSLHRMYVQRPHTIDAILFCDVIVDMAHCMHCYVLLSDEFLSTWLNRDVIIAN